MDFKRKSDHYLIRLARLPKEDIKKLTLLEYLLENKNKETLFKYKKIIENVDFFNLLVLLVFSILASLLSKNILIQLIISIAIPGIISFIINILFKKYFDNLLSELGEEVLFKDIYRTIFTEESKYKLFRFNLLRMNKKFLFKEADNLSDWKIGKELIVDLKIEEGCGDYFEE